LWGTILRQVGGGKGGVDKGVAVVSCVRACVLEAWAKGLSVCGILHRIVHTNYRLG